MSDHAAIKKTLEERLKDLLERANEIEDDLSEQGDDDWQESATESAGDEVLEGVGKAALIEIRGIQIALAAIEDGSYGECSMCGGSIAAVRLEAMPSATKCIRCA